MAERRSTWQSGVKRAVDIVAATVLLILLSPLLLLVAVVIKLDSRGPVFFRQQRLGRGQRPFGIWKFRTMVVGAPDMDGGMLTSQADPRITRIGHHLRKFRIDELPQLINVFVGEMSLVGPRPLVATYFENWSKFDRRRLEVRPGITGWQQVGGGETNTWEERCRLDVWYVDHWSLWLDLKILAKTVPVVLSADTAHGTDGFKRSAFPPGATADAPEWEHSSKGQPEEAPP
jgi:lipopolysaccharide/colanic/teichoic acid biosynthesis glycosyltransferase